LQKTLPAVDRELVAVGGSSVLAVAILHLTYSPPRCSCKIWCISATIHVRVRVMPHVNKLLSFVLSCSYICMCLDFFKWGVNVLHVRQAHLFLCKLSASSLRVTTGRMLSSLGVRDHGLGAAGSFEKYLLLIN
jgi:hypothetical protein